MFLGCSIQLLRSRSVWLWWGGASLHPTTLELFMKQKRMIPKEIKAKRDALMLELEKVLEDPNLRLQGEELHRQISSLSLERLLQPFDI